MVNSGSADVHGVATRLLRLEREDVAATLSNAYDQDYDRATVCDGWQVRDLLAHLIAVLLRAADPDPTFNGTPLQNAHDVALRRDLPPLELAAELDKAYAAAIDGPDAARMALPAWIHSNDLREALNAPEPYCGNGAAEAITLLVQRSVERDLVPVDVTLVDAVDRGLDGAAVSLGDPARPPQGWLRTDVTGLFRIVAGRRVELVEHDIVGVSLSDLVIFR